ncbi:hypothetical protein [Cellulomonas xiejunii]|uniref:hypothetical protein n=1 Tax=Cellulomonas xiejunii TaxID=2968083 RepID=UPI001D0F3DEC|nr:hypothetical protein [Cellulomonas xiejunii]MCC2315106.1 hypothetical protein [Cellulomonas xiejunii]MCC2315689.1 hypothetical protein [Cellulomonas xiejunii]
MFHREGVLVRTFIVVVLSTLGGLVLLIGGAIAALVGPDDTASLPAGKIPATSGVAITSFDLFPVRDLTLHATATSQGGPVFLGAAHPVDARDYVTGVNASWVTGVDRSGTLATDPIDGELDAPEVDPTTTTFWSGSASGDGAQSLDVTLTGEPVTFVVVPLGGPAATTLAFGAVVPGLFVLALGVAGAGAVLVAAAALVRRRGRRRTEPTPDPADADTEPETFTAPEPEPAEAAPRTLRRRALVLGAGLTVTLTACVPVPSAVEPPEQPVRIAADADELDAALASYSERESAASQVAAQLDPGAWADPDTDGRRALMEYRTKLDAARDQPPAPYTVTYSGLDAAVPQFTSYPMWFMALVESTTDGTPAELPQLRVFERERAAAPWRSSFALDVPVDAVQLPAPGSASVASPDQVAAGLAAVELVRSHLETGAEVAVDLGELGTFREKVLGNDLEGRLRVTNAQVTHFDGPEDPTAPGGPLQVVPVDGGLLVTSALSYTFNREMETGWSVNLTDVAVAEVTGQPGERQNLRTLGLVQTVLLVPDGAAPRVLSAGWSLLAPRV